MLRERTANARATTHTTRALVGTSAATSIDHVTTASAITPTVSMALGERTPEKDTANGVIDNARAARAVRSDRACVARRKHQNDAPMRAEHGASMPVLARERFQ